MLILNWKYEENWVSFYLNKSNLEHQLNEFELEEEMKYSDYLADDILIMLTEEMPTKWESLN